MKSLDCNQIKIFINLEIIREEDKYKKIIFTFLNCKKKFNNLVQPLGTTNIYIYIYINFKKNYNLVKPQLLSQTFII